MIRTLFILIAAVFSFTAQAQESLMLTSGKRIYVEAVNLDSAAYVFYKLDNGKIKAIEREDVFSWTRTDSVEVIFYKPACTDVCFQIDQMRDYLHGVADGKELKRPVPVIVGIAAGAAGGFLLPGFISPVIPALDAIGFGIPQPKIENFNIDSRYENNTHYAEGYTESVRRKRVINSLIGGGIGLVAGIVGVSVLSE